MVAAPNGPGADATARSVLFDAATGVVVTIGRHMEVITGAFHIAALVILVGGAAKVVSPGTFASLL
jgi:hypothetical protein